MFSLKHPTSSGQAEKGTEWLEVHGSILNWLIGSPRRQSHTKAMKTKHDCKLFFRNRLKKEKILTTIKCARDESSDTIGGLFNAQVLTLQKWHEYQTNQPNQSDQLRQTFTQC